jgi:hypothetical protein
METPHELPFTQSSALLKIPLDKRTRSIEIFAGNLNGSLWKSL